MFQPNNLQQTIRSCLRYFFLIPIGILWYYIFALWFALDVVRPLYFMIGGTMGRFAIVALNVAVNILLFAIIRRLFKVSSLH